MNASVIVLYAMRPTDADLIQLEELLPLKSQSTLFIFGGREAPGNPDGSLSNHTAYRDLFNLTMGYRRDSDIYFPYAYIRENEKGIFNTGRRHTNNILVILLFFVCVLVQPYSFKELNWSRKSKDILWFVSHCRQDKTNRIEFAKSLEKETTLRCVSIS